MVRNSGIGHFNVKSIIVGFAIIILLAACSDRKNNRRHKASKVIGELQFVVEYRPFLNKRNEKSENKIEYFKIELKHVDDIDIVQYLSETANMKKEEVLYFLSYRLKNDIFLLDQSKKRENVLFHFERSFDLKKGRVFNVGFEPGLNHTKEVTLLIDSEVLNVGPVKLKFKS